MPRDQDRIQIRVSVLRIIQLKGTNVTRSITLLAGEFCRLAGSCGWAGNTLWCPTAPLEVNENRMMLRGATKASLRLPEHKYSD